jgi:hypothetical protein
MIEPPMAEKPDMEALCKGLYGYFPLDGYTQIEYRAKRNRIRKKNVIRGASVQPVTAFVGNPVRDIRTEAQRDNGVPSIPQDFWVEGILGKGLRLRANNLVLFEGFKEPVDKDGLLGDMTVSFWIQGNSKETRGFRLGRGAGLRYPATAVSWYRSWGANYAGWDITRVGSHGETSFTTSMENGFCDGLRGRGFIRDGITWSHVVLTYDREAGEKSI